MESDKRVTLTFKPRRLAKVLESNRNEMIKKKEKAGLAVGVGVAMGVAQLVAADRRGDIHSFLQFLAGEQATVEGQTATLGKKEGNAAQGPAGSQDNGPWVPGGGIRYNRPDD